MGISSKCWIKIQDRKPDVEDDVVVTYEWDDEPGARYVAFGFLSDENGWHLTDPEGNKLVTNYTVIAWCKVKPFN